MFLIKMTWSNMRLTLWVEEELFVVQSYATVSIRSGQGLGQQGVEGICRRSQYINLAL